MTTTDKTISIMLVDDHNILLEAIETVLEKEDAFTIAGRANTCAEAMVVLASTKPDVVVLDLRLPDCDGTDLIPQIIKASSKTKIIVLTIDGSIHAIQKSYSRGAQGYILKNSGTSRLVESIYKVHEGEIYADGFVSEVMLRFLTVPPQEVMDADVELYNSLSPREREVFDFMATGLSTKEIASELGISPKTVETHRQNLYTKIDMHDPIEIIRYAVSIGVVRPELWTKDTDTPVQ